MVISAGLSLAWLDLAASVGGAKQAIGGEIRSLTEPFALAATICTSFLLLVTITIGIVRRGQVGLRALLIVPLWALVTFVLGAAAGLRTTFAYPDHLKDIVTADVEFFWMTVAILSGGLVAGTVVSLLKLDQEKVDSSILTLCQIVPATLGLLTIWLWKIRVLWSNDTKRTLLCVAVILMLGLGTLLARWITRRGMATTLVIVQWIVTVGGALALSPTATTTSLATLQSSTTKTPTVPTVVLITVDTLRADMVGAETGLTPAIDQLAQDSIAYSRATSVSSWTLPSLASILTGLAPDVHRTDAYTRRLPSAINTLAERFHEAGYRTAAVGRSPFLSQGYDLLQGFDSAQHFPRVWPTQSLGTSLVNRFSSKADAGTAEIADLATAWLEDQGSAPVFLWLHIFDPHLPYAPPADLAPIADPPPGFSRSFDRFGAVRSGRLAPDRDARLWIRGLYEAEVRLVDRAIGTVMQSLHRLDRYDDALVVVTADHGEELWDHGGFEHGHSLYQEVIAVPLVIKGPNSRVAPSRVDTPVSTMAVAPTLLDLCELPFEVSDFSATSLAAVGEPPPASVISRGCLYYEQRETVILGRHKYIRNLASETEELYDLELDPEERHSIHEQEPAVMVAARLSLEAANAQALVMRRSLGLEQDNQLVIDAETRERLEALGYSPPQ